MIARTPLLFLLLAGKCYSCIIPGKRKKKKNPHAAKNLLPVERFFNTLVLTYSIYVN